MANEFVPGAMLAQSESDAHILDLAPGLKFLRPTGDGVGLLKRIGLSGKPATNTKIEWTEVSLAGRSETITCTNVATDITVADAYIYQVNDILMIESERVRVTALKDADEITVTRAYAGTTAVAHNAKTMVNLGSADPENSDAPAGMEDNPVNLYNYIQTFTRAVELSNDEIGTAHTEGNPLTGNVARRFIEWTQKFSSALFYGVRYLDTTNKITVMGGLKFFVTTNATSAGGALSITLIDSVIKKIVDAGGDPKVIVMGTKQKQKLDALDQSLVRTGKDSKIGGNQDIQTWQSGIMTHTLDIILDPTIDDAEVWILDTDFLEIRPFVNNGVDGNVHVAEASSPGKDGKKKVIRGKYSLQVNLEKSSGYLYALT